jgi:hypothetical protein
MTGKIATGIAFVLFLIILALAATIPAIADACNPELQDCGSYKDEPSFSPRAQLRKHYAYTVRSTRGNWHCPPELDRRECRKIQAVIDRRRARETVRSRPRDFAQRRIDRVDYRELTRAERRAFGGKKCAGYFKVEGDARITEGLARGNALKEWRQQVRISERGGEPFMDEAYSPNFRIGKCRIVGDRGINKRCTAEGTACRP